VTDDKSSLETCLCLLDLNGPLLAPQILVREESVADLVEGLDWLLEFALFGKLGRELLHGHRNSVEKMTGPSN